MKLIINEISHWIETLFSYIPGMIGIITRSIWYRYQWEKPADILLIKYVAKKGKPIIISTAIASEIVIGYYILVESNVVFRSSYHNLIRIKIY